MEHQDTLDYLPALDVGELDEYEAHSFGCQCDQCCADRLLDMLEERRIDAA